jgi:hypothetical protein
MYFTGFRMGLKDLEKKLEKTRNELVSQGEHIANIIR